MPNQREPHKKQTAFWLTPKERKDLEEAAKAAGMNMSDFVKGAIREWIETRKNNKEEDNDSGK